MPSQLLLRLFRSRPNCAPANRFGFRVVTLWAREMKGPPTEATLIRSVIPQHVYLLRRQWSLYRKAYDTHGLCFGRVGRRRRSPICRSQRAAEQDSVRVFASFPDSALDSQVLLSPLT